LSDKLRYENKYWSCNFWLCALSVTQLTCQFQHTCQSFWSNSMLYLTMLWNMGMGHSFLWQIAGYRGLGHSELAITGSIHCFLVIWYAASINLGLNRSHCLPLGLRNVSRTELQYIGCIEIHAYGFYHRILLSVLEWKCSLIKFWPRHNLRKKRDYKVECNVATWYKEF
jgi:hypothetical protein